MRASSTAAVGAFLLTLMAAEPSAAAPSYYPALWYSKSQQGSRAVSRSLSPPCGLVHRKRHESGGDRGGESDGESGGDVGDVVDLVPHYLGSADPMVSGPTFVAELK